MTDEERGYIFLIETFEKDDLVDIPSLIQKYKTMAIRREFSATMIIDQKYKDIALNLAKWDRKVVEALQSWK